MRVTRQVPFGVLRVVLVCLAACGSEAMDPGTPERSQDSGSDAGGGDEGLYDTSECEEGETRTCKVEVGTHNGVTTCVTGTQGCSGGTWSECEESVPLSANYAESEAEGGSEG